MDNLLGSRAEAKAAGETFYSTGRPCKHGHVTRRRTSSGVCEGCLTKYRALNSSAVSSQKKEYYLRNKRSLKEYSKRYRKENRSEKIAYLSEWKRRNSARVNAARMRRHADKIQRTPVWLSESQKEAIILFYKEARRKTELTGEPHHVDHIIPLRGKTVSGLHVPANLQVISAFDNLSKSNRYGAAL